MHHNNNRSILASERPGRVKRLLVPRAFRTKLSIALEDINTEEPDLSKRMTAFSTILDRGNSRQILGLFETGLCPKEQELEVCTKFERTLGSEISNIMAPVQYYHDPNPRHSEYYSRLAYTHRRDAYTTAWQVLVSGQIKSPEAQKFMAQIISSNFPEIIIDNFDTSKIDPSVTSFISEQTSVKQSLERKRQEAIPTPQTLAFDIARGDTSNNQLVHEASFSENDNDFEINFRALLLRAKFNLNGDVLDGLNLLTASPKISAPLFIGTLPAILDALGIDELVRIRDAHHFAGSDSTLGFEKLNALKRYINEKQEPKKPSMRPETEYPDDEPNLID